MSSGYSMGRVLLLHWMLFLVGWVGVQVSGENASDAAVYIVALKQAPATYYYGDNKFEAVHFGHRSPERLDAKRYPG